MMKLIPALLGMLFCWSLTAQTTILDFETSATSTTYQYFGSSLDGTLNNIITNPDASGINTSSMVADHVKPAGSETFAGAFPNPVQATSFDFTGQSEICVKVWRSEPGSVSLKFENSTNGAQNWLGTQEVTETMTWVNVCFDVARPSLEGPFEPVVGGQYAGAVIFFDFGEVLTEDRTYYFDDMVVNPGITALSSDVTFSVDMNGYTDPITVVNVFGAFNGWSPDANPLSDTDGDGVWEATVSGIPGGGNEYKFNVNGDPQEQFIGTETCTVTDPSGQFTNRFLFVDEASMSLETVCYNSCYACGDAVQITFMVNAESVSTSGDGIFIAGGENFGVPGDNRMNDDDGDDIWELTFEREIGFSSLYAYANGFCPDFTCKETLAGQPCANGQFSDRLLPPVMQDTVLMTCYQQCSSDLTCGVVGQDGNITFQVDMNDFPDAITTVSVFGAFNGWSPDANPMTDDNGDGIWETTALLPTGSQEYLFLVNGVAENFSGGEACTTGEGEFVNRLIEVDGDATVCFFWETCTVCEDIPPQVYAMTFQVDMSNYDGAFSNVSIFGAFNGWSPDANPMMDPDGDNIWEATVMMAEGDQEYLFFVDGAAESFSPGAPCTIGEEFVNRLITVTGEATVCYFWETCTDCSDTPPQMYAMTFQVDMSDYTEPITNVSIFGAFNGWSPDANPMTDDNGDGIWEATVMMQEGDQEYLFFVDGAAESFSPGTPCTIGEEFVNRLITVTGEATVCFFWETCTDCNDTPPQMYAITFQVDMSNYADAFSSVSIFGAFNGWSPDANQMTDIDGDNVWETTVMMLEGGNEYKFAVDNAMPAENFAAGSPCTVTDPSGEFTNRFIEVTEDAIVCFFWETCTECDATPPQMYSVTFQVDMNDYADPISNVSIFGAFNGWSPDANQMTDADGDGIWETTVSMTAGLQEYKFVVDNGAVTEEFMAGAECTITDVSGEFTNRAITITEDTEVCFLWNTCDACIDVANRNLTIDESIFTVSPTLVNDFATVVFNEQIQKDKVLRVFNSTGVLLQDFQVEASVNQQLIPTADLAPGMYLVFVQTGNTIATKKIVKQ